MIFHPIIGGGAGSLNVTSYASVDGLPASAEDGAIAVISEVSVGDVHVQQSEPSEPKAGDLWIAYSFKGTLPITVGSITLFPRKAYQYNGTKWDAVELKVRNNGVWETSVGSEVIYSPGDEHVDMTGGWVSATAGSTVVKKETGMYIRGGPVATALKIDLTHYATVKFNVRCHSSIISEVGVGTEQDTLAVNVSTGASEKEAFERTVPVDSLKGEYYIIVNSRTSGSDTDVFGVELLA